MPVRAAARIHPTNDGDLAFRAATESAFTRQQQSIFRRTDRVFARLMLLQWIGAMVAAAWISPRTWAGEASSVHQHFWAAILLGGALASLPVALAVRRPGTVLTRQVIAVSQALFSALLIHLTGGRIETHFHVFGSLAFLATYRDIRILMLAASVVLTDHVVRGILWPESVYGVLAAPLWRSFEHAGWVAFELAFLVIATRQSLGEMRDIAIRQVKAARAHDDVERQVELRTAALARAEARHRAIVETAVDGILTFDAEGSVQSVNPAAERIFGRSSRDILGARIADLLANSGLPANAHLSALLEQVGAMDGRLSLFGRRADGCTFPLDLSISTIHHGTHTAIVRDVTERTIVDRMKTEFVSTVSHELRTPLTSIRGSLGLVSGGVGGLLPQKARQLIDIAVQNCERLVRLVNDILDIEKIESGRMVFRLASHDLAEVVRDAVASMESYAIERGANIRVQSDASTSILDIDRDRIIQVLTNLLSNAAKFSPSGSEIVVALQTEDDRVRVEVRDSGPGIPKEFRERIFGRFAQADSSDVRQQNGTGLGLSISKAIVESHGGAIGFDSELGVGSAFWFSLPKSSGETPSDPPPRPTESRPRALVCEDDPDIASLLKIMLQQAGVDVDVAYDARSARALIGEFDYDLMTLDIMLPGEGGLDLLQSIRREPATRAMPVVVVSAKADQCRRDPDSDTLDVVGWIEKPIDQSHLLSAVRAAVRARRDPEGRGRASVLHVEDNDDLALVVSEALGPVACVQQARTLGEARSLMASTPFEVIILDLELPDGCGLELLQESGRDDVPIVVFSASTPEAAVRDRCAATFVKARADLAHLIQAIISIIRHDTHDTQPATHSNR